MQRSLGVIALAAAVAPAPAIGQGGYRPTGDTVVYQATNRYLMYFVRGADTLGQPVSSRTRERQIAVATPDGLALVVELHGLDAPFHAADTFDIARSGRVRRIGGQLPEERAVARVDVLPRFPESHPALTVGLEWTDTVSVAQAKPYGSTYYRARRRYRVARIVDTAGMNLAVITGNGEIALRQGGWQDSVARVVWWQEVAGPVVDSVWFDIRRGWLVEDAAHMNLRGTGGVGPIGGGGLMPSGLQSVIRRVRP